MKNWNDLNSFVANRISIIELYLRFHQEAEHLVNLFDNLEQTLKTTKRSEEFHYVDTVWTKIQTQFSLLKNIAKHFNAEKVKVWDTHVLTGFIETFSLLKSAFTNSFEKLWFVRVCTQNNNFLERCQCFLLCLYTRLFLEAAYYVRRKKKSRTTVTFNARDCFHVRVKMLIINFPLRFFFLSFLFENSKFRMRKNHSWSETVNCRGYLTVYTHSKILIKNFLLLFFFGLVYFHLFLSLSLAHKFSYISILCNAHRFKSRIFKSIAQQTVSRRHSTRSVVVNWKWVRYGRVLISARRSPLYWRKSWLRMLRWIFMIK